MSTVQPRAKSLQDDAQTQLGGVVIWREMTGALHDKARQGCDDGAVAIMPANQPSAPGSSSSSIHVATATARSTATF
jgi:hypothetical protein